MPPGGAAARWKSLETDGAITPSAFSAALAVHGVDTATAQTLFKELDLDADGR
jgi:hypothetical protein